MSSGRRLGGRRVGARAGDGRTSSPGRQQTNGAMQERKQELAAWVREAMQQRGRVGWRQAAAAAGAAATAAHRQTQQQDGQRSWAIAWMGYGGMEAEGGGRLGCRRPTCRQRCQMGLPDQLAHGIGKKQQDLTWSRWRGCLCASFEHPR